MPVTTQIPLDLGLRPNYRASRFIASQSNAEARVALSRFPAWPKSALAIVGDGGTGKTHLGHGFIADHNGLLLPVENTLVDAALWRGRVIWVDEASRASEELLFGLINMAHTGEIAGLILTARKLPNLWSVSIPDLRSRLGALQVARISEPDDALLEAIYRKLFLDHGLKVSDALIAYLMLRMERSVDAARSVVALLDREAAAQKVNVTRSFAAKILDQQGELF